MKNANSLDVGSLREFIEAFEKAKGGPRPAARSIDVKHGLLYSWKIGTKNQEFLNKMEEIRKELGLSKSKAWDALITKSKKG